MEILLLFALAGGLAWVWNRMESLERRVAGLEGAPGTIEDTWPPRHEALSYAPDVPAAQSQPEPEPEDKETTIPPTVAADIAAADEMFATEESIFRQSHRFRLSFDFEEIFGRLLPIWGGGIALAIAGFFLVRWSIDRGMLTQSVRVAMGFAFGMLLLGAAELAFRFEHRISDERVRQALAGAGLATLYASFYLAGTHYGLIGPTLSFAGLAGVTALAVGLSFRFGLPSAVLGLIGGFAAPALAGSTDPHLPLLATYLALVTGGLTVTGQRQKYPWLGLAALGGGLGWGALMLLTGPLDDTGILAIGGYLILVGALLPSIMGTGPLGTVGRIAAAGFATMQIAALVDQSGYSPLAWGSYLLLGGAIAILGFKFIRLREAGAIAAALSVCLLAAWPHADGGWFTAIAFANALVFAAAPLVHVWRREAADIDWAQLAIYPIALVVAICIQLGVSPIANQAMPIALGSLALMILPALGAWITRPLGEDAFARGPFAAFSSAVILTILAGLLATPEWAAPLITAVLSVPVFLILRERTETMPRALRWGVALAGVVLLLVTNSWQEADLVGNGSAAPEWLYAMRWLAAGIPFGLLIAREPEGIARRFGEVLAALLTYGAAAMLVPGPWLPLVIAVAVLGMAWRLPAYRSAIVTLLVLGTLWAAEPLADWTIAGFASLFGQAVMLSNLPSLADALQFIAPLAAGIGGVALLSFDGSAHFRRLRLTTAAALVLVVLHVGYKQIFAIADPVRFVEYGLAERTLWEALLASAALGLASQASKLAVPARIGMEIALVAVAHFTMFSLLLHNPLWADQAVGSWPIANLLILSYGLAIGLVLMLRETPELKSQRLRPAFDAAVMVLIAMLAQSELRQLFSGSLLLGPIGQQEDLLRSILAIAVALGFLGWGARTDQRSWRVGSLVLMLLAVIKVFIFDAAGLEGLARIASFLALGVCLIGIGWFYSRQLAGKPVAKIAVGST
jgi:uncharacterized membrane protein